MKKLLLAFIMVASSSVCYGQEIHRNPYKTICETENGVKFTEQVNFSDKTRVEMEKQLERAQSEEAKKMIREMFGKLLSEDERMEKEGMYFISVPEFELEGYSNIIISATREKMMSLLKVLSTGDFRDGDSVRHNKVVFTYKELDDKFIVSKTESGVTSTGFVYRSEFKEMYEKMKDLQAAPASN